MTNKDKYFNFPICLISGIFEDKTKVMNNILDYAIYAKAVSLENGSIKEKIISSGKYFGVILGDVTRSLKNGNMLYRSIPKDSPITNIKVNLWFDFYKNEKSAFEIAVFCGFCAIRSILLFKPYCKITNSYMLVRMAGIGSIKNIESLPDALKKYRHRYHMDKIKMELRTNWKLKIYSKHTRGFYVSFEKELTDLIFEAEKKRKKYIEKNYQNQESEARKNALKKLYEPLT